MIVRVHRKTPVGLCFGFAFLLGLLAARSGSAVVFERGDANVDGRKDITDGIFVLNFLFLGAQAPLCTPVANSNGDPQLNISDPVYYLNFLFLGGPAPPPLTLEDLNACRGLTPEAIARGKEEFEEADADGNLFACATCHSMEPDGGPGIIMVGHTLLNSLARPSFKTGGVPAYVGAVNVCRSDWMVVSSPFPPFAYIPWTEDEPRFKDLAAFILSLSPAQTAPGLEYEIVAPARTGPPAPTASAAAGCELFNRSCSVCHAAGGVGSDLATSLVDLQTCDLNDTDFIRERIRLSGPNHEGNPYHPPEGFELLGTVMPFWAKDKLSDDQVEDLVAFIAAGREAVRHGGETFGCADALPTEGNVVRRGELTTLAHNVSGIVEQLDTRVLRLKEFNYDGGGIVVQVWVYSSTGDIRGGRAIGCDLKDNPQAGSTLLVDIPSNIPADSFDSVSIWCVRAKEDFGHAALQPVQ